ncbi:MAG: DUF721 domain-containing protein [Zoogloeaceae bacterium]|jgi:hypothetical protein|nr:DUF721 domain-containing protein [Zoogloeaceae bacterium]
MLTANDLFIRSESTARLIAHARLIARLGECFAQIAPANLGAQARVANYRPETETVVIHANNGAVAAKIRQINQRLQNGFVKMGMQCNQIEIKVQPMQNPAQLITSEKKFLTRHSARSLLACADAMPPGAPLALALRALLARASIRDQEEEPGGKK